MPKHKFYSKVQDLFHRETHKNQTFSVSTRFKLVYALKPVWYCGILRHSRNRNELLMSDNKIWLGLEEFLHNFNIEDACFSFIS